MILLVHPNIQRPDNTIRWMWNILQNKDVAVLLSYPSTTDGEGDPYQSLLRMFHKRIQRLSLTQDRIQHWREALDASWHWDCLVEIPPGVWPTRASLQELETALEIADVAVARPSLRSPRSIRRDFYRTCTRRMIPKLLRIPMPPVIGSMRAWKRDLLSSIIPNASPSTNGSMFNISTISAALALGAGVITVPLVESTKEPITLATAWEEGVSLWRLRHSIRQLPMIHHVAINRFHHL